MTNNQTDWKELCAQLYAALEAHSTTWDDEVLLDRVGTALRLAQPEPEPDGPTDIERERQEAADQELDACCEWLDREGWSGESRQLRSARRPKPLSEKQQALEDLDGLEADLAKYGMGFKTTNIRRALEQLDD